MMVSSVAIIMGTSDNAYLTLGALLGFLPLYLFRTWSGIRRYLMAAAGFFTAAWIVEWANVKYADKVLGIDSCLLCSSSTSILRRSSWPCGSQRRC